MKPPAPSDALIYAREAFREAWPGVRHVAVRPLRCDDGELAYCEDVVHVAGVRCLPERVVAIWWIHEDARPCMVKLHSVELSTAAVGQARSYTEAIRLALQHREVILATPPSPDNIPF